MNRHFAPCKTSLRGRNFAKKRNAVDGLQAELVQHMIFHPVNRWSVSREASSQSEHRQVGPMPACRMGQLFPHAGGGQARSTTERWPRLQELSGMAVSAARRQIHRTVQLGAMRQAVPAGLRKWPNLSHEIQSAEIETFARFKSAMRLAGQCEATYRRHGPDAAVATACLGAGGTQFARRLWRRTLRGINHAGVEGRSGTWTGARIGCLR